MLQFLIAYENFHLGSLRSSSQIFLIMYKDAFSKKVKIIVKKDYNKQNIRGTEFISMILIKEVADKLKLRYLLNIKLPSNSGERAVFITMNPSDANTENGDPTVTKIINDLVKKQKKKVYSELIVLNVLPLIEDNSHKLKDNFNDYFSNNKKELCDILSINKQFIKWIITEEKTKDIFICTGNPVFHEMEIIMNGIYNLLYDEKKSRHKFYAYDINATGYGRHPGRCKFCEDLNAIKLIKDNDKVRCNV